MEDDTRTSIAYIAGRLISGKSIASLYDYARSRRIDITSIPHARSLKQFNYARQSSLSRSSQGSRYRYLLGDDGVLDLTVSGNAFIGYFRTNASDFVGKVWGDSIYLYDHEESAHFNYRIFGCVVEHEGGCSVCHCCFLARERDA
jgi:hypothetical protein